MKTKNKILKIYLFNDECEFAYFLKIDKGLIVTTQNKEKAKRYTSKGVSIAKSCIQRWGHEYIILSEDV